MIKVITKLTHDLKAQAGQLLILHENGKVYAVDQNKIDSLFTPVRKKEVKQRVAVYNLSAPTLKQRREQMVDMLYRGYTLREICVATGFARVTVARHRSNMIKLGKLETEQVREAGKHYWFKSPEALEKARQRGRLLGKRKAS